MTVDCENFLTFTSAKGLRINTRREIDGLIIFVSLHFTAVAKLDKGKKSNCVPIS